MFSDLAIVAGGVLACILALLGYGARQRSKGGADEKQRQAEADHETARSIRDRVERDLPDRVRNYDDAGFRD